MIRLLVDDGFVVHLLPKLPERHVGGGSEPCIPIQQPSCTNFLQLRLLLVKITVIEQCGNDCKTQHFCAAADELAGTIMVLT